MSDINSAPAPRRPGLGLVVALVVTALVVGLGALLYGGDDGSTNVNVTTSIKCKKPVYGADSAPAGSQFYGPPQVITTPQGVVDRMVAKGCDPSFIASTLETKEVKGNMKQFSAARANKLAKQLNGDMALLSRTATALLQSVKSVALQQDVKGDYLTAGMLPHKGKQPPVIVTANGTFTKGATVATVTFKDGPQVDLDEDCDGQPRTAKEATPEPPVVALVPPAHTKPPATKPPTSTHTTPPATPPTSTHTTTPPATPPTLPALTCKQRFGPGFHADASRPTGCTKDGSASVQPVQPTNQPGGNASPIPVPGGGDTGKCFSDVDGKTTPCPGTT